MKLKTIGIIVAALCLSGLWSCEQQEEAYQRGTLKAKQIEAKINLEALAVAQAGFKAVQNRFGASFAEIGFGVTGEDQRYSYFLGDDVIKGARGPSTLPEGIKPATVTENGYAAYAIANLDDDPELDVWVINQAKVVRQVKNDM